MKNKYVGLKITNIILLNLCIGALVMAEDLSNDGNNAINIDGKEYSGQKVVSDNYGASLALVQATADSILNITNSDFLNNYAKSNNTANGTYGVAVSATAANTVSIDNVKFNFNQVESENMTQGTVYSSGSQNVSVKNSEFISNKAGAESGTSYSAGGALSLWGNKSTTIENTKFENNVAKGADWGDGGAVYARGATWGGYEPSVLHIKDSTFASNTIESSTSSRGGALFLKSEANTNAINSEVTDTVFTDNKSVTTDAENAYGDQGGGAIYNENSQLKITATKDITNVGNAAVVGGKNDDSRGGFLYMYSGEEANGAPSTEFAVAENATLTIGDGTAGQDSIASNDSKSTITKTGAGTLTVNGSMSGFTGTLNVSEGTMNVNNGLGGEANANNSALNIANANYDGIVLEKAANGSPTAIVNATNNAELSLKNSSFKNNTVSTTGTANGTYGVAVGINSSNATIEGTVFENNTNISTGSLMSQGVVYLTVSEQTTIKDSNFTGNKSVSDGYALGGAVSSFGSNLSIEKTDFVGNSVKGDSADGSAVYAAGNDWGGANPSTVNISNSTFEGNVSEGTSIARGAVFAGGDNPNTLVVNITDSSFTNNVAKGDSYVAGGAISVQDQKVNINVTKDMTYAGNQAIVNGVADDSRGGFLFINSKNVSSDTSFNISENATLTIGDGRDGYDSIASRDEKAVINKSGAGTLTVNGSMSGFSGTLNVSEGTMNANKGLGANDINVAGGATLNSDGGKWTNIQKTASWSNLEYYPDPIAEVAAGGTLNLDNATFENNTLTHNGSLASGVGTKGAIWVNGGRLTMTDSVVDGTVSVTNPGDKASWNSTPNSQGGAILFNGATSSGTFSNVQFSNNSATSVNVQGGVIAAFGGKYEFKDGMSFTGNKAATLEGSTSSISGGVMYMTDNWSDGTLNIDISNATFSDNTAEGYIANAGAIIYESYKEGSNLTVSDTVFSGNKAIGETRAEGGAMRLFTTSTSEKVVLNDVSFVNNAVEVESPTDMSRNGGGAIYANATDVEFNVTKDAVISGNYVSVNGQKNDELGGFMRLSNYNGSASSASFNVSESATLTIGDGTAGSDSIASTDTTAVVNKSGAGTLTVNGSMSSFTGTLNVSKGTINVNNGLGATKTVVDNSAANISGADLSGQNYVSQGEYGSRLALVEARNNAQLTISDSKYSNNSAEYTLSDVNGVYGSVISSTDSNTQIKNTVFEGNTNSTTAQVQGIVYLSGGSMEIESSSFVGNKGNGGVNTTGAAVTTYGGNLTISGTTFDGNIANSDAMARGGALYGDNYAQTENGTIITVSDSVFSNNKAVSQSDAWGGAVQISFAKANNGSMTFKDTVFTDNTVEATSASGNAFGGAVGSRRADVTFEVSEGKNIVNTGNLAIVDGVASDANGGFLYMYNDTSFQDEGSRSTAYFNIASNASMTIGDGTSGRDSIASSDNTASIVKNGRGILTVNSSMEHYTGSLAVNQGEMSVTNKLGASSISISSDATLHLTVGEEPVLTNENLSFSNSGTLALIAKNSSSGKIAAASGLDFGNMKAYGGTFDASSGMFTNGYVTETNYGDMGMATTSGAGTMKFSDDTSSITVVTQGDTAFGENVRNDSVAADAFGANLLAAWNVNYESEETVVLSFSLDADMSGVNLYYMGETGVWSKLDSWLEDGSLNTITGEVGNFALAIPEPSVYAALLGAISLAFAACRRRK